MFYIAAGFYVFGSIFYGFFASGEVQPWARDKTSEAVEEELLHGTELQVKTTENGVVVSTENNI